MEESGALGLALGHVRNAVAGFWAVEDPSGESLFWAAECVDLEGLFADLGVVPVFVEPGLDPLASLDAAAAVLSEARGRVPLALWAALQAVRSRASR